MGIKSARVVATTMTLTAALLLAAGCNAGAAESEVQASLQRTLAQARPPYVTADAEGRKLWQLTKQFYERRQQQPAWIDGTKPLPHVAELFAALNSATLEGLDPQLYNVALLEQKHQIASKGFLSKKGFEPAEAGEQDVWLTYLYLKYASDLADGLSDLAQADKSWQIRPEKFDATARLEEALQNNRIEKSLRELTPENPQYQALRKVLGEYRAQAAKSGWPVVPATAKLKPGQKSPVVAIIAERLSASGDYTGAAVAGGCGPVLGQLAGSGQALSAPSRSDRRRGPVGRDDRADERAGRAAHQPDRAESRALALAAARISASGTFSSTFPRYRLEVWDRNQVPLSMRVVVGKKDTQTPIFNDEMTYLVFRPYWNVPPDIVKNETLPQVLRDPAFLRAHQHGSASTPAATPSIPRRSIWTNPSGYRFRQRPGARNSLGLVKFMFPNQFNVYLHDTPADSLFARATPLLQPRLRASRAIRQSSRNTCSRDQPRWTRGADPARRCTPARRTHREAEPGASGLSRLLDRTGLGRRRPAVPAATSTASTVASARCWPIGCPGCGRPRPPRPAPPAFARGRRRRLSRHSAAKRRDGGRPAFRARLGRPTALGWADLFRAVLSDLGEELLEIDGFGKVGVGLDVGNPVLAGRRHHDDRNRRERLRPAPAASGTASRPSPASSDRGG